MIRVLATSFFLVFTTSLFSQSFQKIVYSVDEGLVTHLVKAAEFDAIGYLWIGTDEGLVRYDGRNFTTFPYATPSRYIKRIVKTPEGLMVLSDLGITKIHPGIDTVQFEQLWQGQRSPTDSTVWYPKDLYVDRAGGYWVTEPGSILKLKGKTFKRYHFDASDLSSSFFWSFSLFEIEKQLFVISFTGSVYRYEPGQDLFVSVNLYSDIPIKSVHSILKLDDQILLGDEDGLHKIWYNHEGLHASSLSELGITNVSCIYRYDSNTVVIGNFDDKLWSLKLPDFKISDKQQVFRPNHITASESGNLWVSSDEGIVLLKKNFFGRMTEEDHYIESVAIVGDGGYYCYKDGLYEFRFENGKYRQRQIIKGNDQYFLSISGNREDLWVSNKSKVMHLSDGKLIDQIDLSERGLFIFDLLYDSKKQLWVSQDNVEGLLRIAPDHQRQEYRKEKGLDTRVLVIYDYDETVYCGGGGEKSYFYKYDEVQDRFVNLSRPLGFQPSTDFEVNDIAARNDTVWLATTSGLMCYTGDTIVRQDLKDLTALPVKAVCLENNYVWFSNTYGIIRLDLNRPSNFIVLNETSGLSSRSGNARGLKIDSRGTKWIGTAKGLCYTLGGNENFHKTRKPFLSQVEVNAAVLPLDDFDDITVPNDAFLKLSFLALTLPGTFLEYQVKNMNTGSEWKSFDTHNYIELANLGYGDYGFQVRAKQKGNFLWSDPATIHFTVDRPFYQKWWFISLVVFVASLLIYGSYKANSYRVRKIHQRLNDLVNERTIQLQTANEELQQTNRELDMFVYSASHDLKAPLSSVMGLLNLYRLEDDASARDDLIKRMRDSILKLDTFIKDVIDYSKNTRLEIINEPVDFQEIIKAVLDSYKYLENFEHVNTSIFVEEGVYVTDRNRMRIVFNNLISNAIRYSDPSKSDGYVNIIIKKDGNLIAITVEDNGIGISDRHKKKVFDMFYRANEEKVGSGLGLYIVKEAVTTLGGSITLESEPGTGTTFHIKVPNQR